MSKSIVSKPSQKVIASAVESATQSTSVEAYTTIYTTDAGKKVEGSYEPFRNQGLPYGVLSGAASASALITCGAMLITPAGRLEPVKDAKPNMALLKRLLSPTAFNKFTKGASNHGVLIDSKGVTPDGTKFFNNRLIDAGPAFNTTKEIVDSFVVSRGTGKALGIKGVTGIKFVKVDAPRVAK